jgi:cold shock CspA family protein
VKGTIKSLNPIGHGIIRAEDGSKLPFLFVDVLSRKELVLGQRVIFSIRTVQDKVFAENISYQTGTSGDAGITAGH